MQRSQHGTSANHTLYTIGWVRQNVKQIHSLRVRMKCYLVLVVVIIRANFLKVEADCNAGKGKPFYKIYTLFLFYLCMQVNNLSR